MARVAIVTGGTRGIGEAISIALKNSGMKVAANYAGNDERAREFTERTGIPAFKWDVADFDACQAGVQKVESDLGPVDVLVNNAGITRDTTMKRMDHQKWQDVIDTNLGGCFNMAKAVFEGMQGRGYGRIVNIGSIHALIASPFKSAYVAAKHGLVGFSKAVALETHDVDITINTVCPGYVKTPLVEAQIASLARTHHMSPEQVVEEIMLKPMPKRQFITPEELIGSVEFLLGPAARNITGQCLVLDGGWTAQ